MKSPLDHSSTEPLMPASPKSFMVALARRYQFPLLTAIVKDASKRTISSRFTVPVRLSVNDFAAMPSSALLEVLRASVPVPESRNRPEPALALTETASRSANPLPCTAAPPFASKTSPARSKCSANSSWKPVGAMVIATEPLAVASPARSIRALIASRKPGATVTEPKARAVPVVFSSTVAEADAPMPRLIPLPKLASRLTSKRATSPAELTLRPESRRVTDPIPLSCIVPLTRSSRPVSETSSSTWPLTTRVSSSRRSPPISSRHPRVIPISCDPTTRAPAASRWNPLNSCTPPTVVVFTAKVWMVWAWSKEFSSSRNWPLRLTPGMELAPTVSWIRPTTPVPAVPARAVRLTTPVTEPRNGMVPPTAPSTMRYASSGVPPVVIPR